MRVFRALKMYGFCGVAIKLFKKIFHRIYFFFDRLDEKNLEKQKARRKKVLKPEYDFLTQLCENKKYKKIFVFYPYSEWHMVIFQRSQQMALALSGRDDVLFLFCTTNCQLDHVEGLYEKINENLYLVTDYEFFTSLPLSNRVIHFYSTDILSDYSEFEKAFARGDQVLYEYIDEIHEDITKCAPKHYLEKHEKAMADERVCVIASADKLIQDTKQVRNNNFALATNGVNIEDFTREAVMPEALEEIKQKYKKIICYYGALAVWFDYELLKKCARAYPDYAFVLIGIKYDEAFDASGVSEIENIIYLGKVHYTKLIDYTRHVDLLTIPFLINEITKSTSPVKLFEYMATQVPILTTGMKECKKYKSVIIGENHEDYIAKIESTIRLIDDPEYLKLEMSEAEDNTWQSKSETIMNLLLDQDANSQSQKGI